MSVQAKQVSVGVAATSLHAETGGIPGARLKLKNAGGASVFLGPSDVTPATGYELATGEVTDVVLGGGEELFGIVAAASEPVHVLVTKD